jgi:NitT/TauT family transport system substrate-binding protein
LVLSESWCERLEIVRLQRPEFIATTLDEVAALSREGFGYLPFYRLLDSQGLDAVVVGSGVDATGLEELHGRKVGYEAGSISQLWFAQLLDDAGCGYGHVEHKPFVSIEDAAHALHDGRIDAAVLWSPWIEASGGRVLVASGDPGQVINDVLCVREDLDPALASIAAAITAAFDAFARGHREYDARTARRFLGLCPDEISQQLAGVRFLSWAQSRVLFEEGATRKGGVQWTAERICELLGMDTRFLCLARSRAWVASVSAALRVHEC